MERKLTLRGFDYDKSQSRGEFGYGNYCTIRASRTVNVGIYGLSALQLKIKGRDCGTINGHNKSLSIRTLMKDAREALVR